MKTGGKEVRVKEGSSEQRTVTDSCVLVNSDAEEACIGSSWESKLKTSNNHTGGGGSKKKEKETRCNVALLAIYRYCMKEHLPLFIPLCQQHTASFSR